MTNEIRKGRAKGGYARVRLASAKTRGPPLRRRRPRHDGRTAARSMMSPVCWRASRANSISPT